MLICLKHLANHHAPRMPVSSSLPHLLRTKRLSCLSLCPGLLLRSKKSLILQLLKILQPNQMKLNSLLTKFPLHLLMIQTMLSLTRVKSRGPALVQMATPPQRDQSSSTAMPWDGHVRMGILCFPLTSKVRSTTGGSCC